VSGLKWVAVSTSERVVNITGRPTGTVTVSRNSNEQ